MPKKDEAKKSYELLSPVNFGLLENDAGRVLPEDEQPDPHGELPAGEVVDLPESQGEALVQAGSAKLAGSDVPVGLNHDNPEELGYEGDAAKKAEAKKADAKADAKAEPKPQA